MRSKQIYFMAAIFVALALVAYFAYQSKMAPEQRAAQTGKKKMFPNFKADEAKKLKIKSLGSEATLQRDDTGTWIVPDKGNYPADKKALQQILDAIESMDTGTVVSHNPEKQRLYEVDEMMGTEVTFLDKSDQEIAHFFVGKAGQDFFSTNVRLAGTNDVRLVNKMLSHMFKRPGGDWRDKLIFDIDEAKIAKLSVTGEEGTVIFGKSEQGTWSTIEPAGKEADAEEIKRCAAAFAKLRASGFADEKDKDKFALDKPGRVITATTDDGEAHTLNVCGEKSKAQFFVQRAGSDTVFFISKYQIDRMSKSWEHILGIEVEKSKKMHPPKGMQLPKPKKENK